MFYFIFNLKQFKLFLLSSDDFAHYIRNCTILFFSYGTAGFWNTGGDTVFSYMVHSFVTKNLGCHTHSPNAA